MPRYNIHAAPICADLMADADPLVIVTLTAESDAEAERMARILFPALGDVQAIECAECSVPIEDCDCHDRDYEPIDLELAHFAKACNRGTFCTSADGRLCWSWSGSPRMVPVTLDSNAIAVGDRSADECVAELMGEQR